jgi:ERCC4-type nuclease
VILVDTREQHPLEPCVYRGGRGAERAWLKLPTERATLQAGDYTVRGAEHLVAVERKSIADLYGTLYGSAETANGERAGHLDRFLAELERLQTYARRYWLIEGSPGELDDYVMRRSRRVNPVDAHALVAALSLDYDIPTIWMQDRLRASHWLGVVLGRVEEQLVDGSAAHKKALTRGFTTEVMPWLGTT